MRDCPTMMEGLISLLVSRIWTRMGLKNFLDFPHIARWYCVSEAVSIDRDLALAFLTVKHFTDFPKRRDKKDIAKNLH